LGAVYSLPIARLPDACDDGPVKAALLALAAATGVFVAIIALATARSGPGYSFAGGSAWRSVVELAAGWSLLGVGLVAWWRQPRSRLGVLLAAGSLAWFLPEWNSPAIGSALGFTVGLTLYVAAAPLVAHVALAYPSGQISSRLERLALMSAYLVNVLLLGLLPALVFDPRAHGCNQCSGNLLVAHDSPHLFDELNRLGVQLGLSWSLVLLALLAARLVRSTPAFRRLISPVVVAAAAYLGVVALDFAHSLGRGTVGNDAIDRASWLAEAVALVALALAVGWGWIRVIRLRRALARLVIEFSDAPAPGGLGALLATSLGDASLQLGYPLSDGRVVDARGQALSPAGVATPIVAGGHRLALLWHRPGLLEDPSLPEEVAAAARLALENERLQAELRAQLADLRASRVRIVAAGDAERRRLERDLHDGAQQRLVALSLALRLTRARVEAKVDSSAIARIERAEAELHSAIGELRELAHGIYPAVLAEEGLAAALEALAERTRVPLELHLQADMQLDAAVEATAYFLVAQTVKRTSSGAVAVRAALDEDLLLLEIDCSAAPGRPVDLEERIAALDGKLTISNGSGAHPTVRAEIPCAS
jgi:signal transduction histidine kinase